MNCKGEVEDKYILSGNTLKTIAFITMFIDHVARAFLYYLVVKRGTGMEPRMLEFLQNAYTVMRSVGRISFPLFAYLAVEGALGSRHPWRYAGRLLAAALISEIPFDMALYLVPFYPDYQNVLWTLLMGVVMIRICESDRITNKFVSYSMILKWITAVITCLIVWVLKTDYSYSGVALMFILYIFRDHRVFSLFAGFLVFFSVNERPWAAPAFILMYFYNGKRTKRALPYLSYMIYPVHFLILRALTQIFALGL